LYVSLVILTSALTGMPIAFKWVRNGINLIVGSVPAAPVPKSKPLSAGQSRLGAEELWRRAQALIPDETEAIMRYPLAPKDPVEFDFLESGAPHPEAHSYVYLDAYSGDALRVTHYADNSLGDKIYGWDVAIHTGLVGGFLVQLLLCVGALGIPVQAYTGIGSYIRSKLRAPVAGRITVRVAKVSAEAEEISSFELADPSGSKLPAFSAGSHIDVHIREGLIRQYSLCNDPSEKHRYLIGVLRAPASRGGSRAMHDDVREGDLIQIGEPKNHFPLARAAKRSLLIAGGIGITPILCMAERLSNIGAAFEMHYCSRSLERTAFVERIRKSAYADRASLHLDDGPAEQRLDLVRLLNNPHSGTHLYVCGPTGFMDHVIDTAAKQGWANDRVHREYFAGAVQNTEGNVEFDVKLASTGKVYRVGREQTVTEALTVHGVDIPTACGQGVCGTCLTRVVEGDPEHRDLYLTEEERGKNDQFMPCCSRATSPMLVLDL
jgi:vanillate O-demethylase ferredoxin subunit